MARITHQICLTTCPNLASAKRVARALVAERLAACINIIPIKQSVYRWKGGIESAPEFLLVIKSTVMRYKAIATRLHALHPYELPELVTVPITGGSAKYLAWLTHPDKT